MTRHLSRRLARIEAKRLTLAPEAVFSTRPITPDEAASAIANWRTWVAGGRARISGRALMIQGPRLAVKEWEALYSPKVLQ